MPYSRLNRKVSVPQLFKGSAKGDRCLWCDRHIKTSPYPEVHVQWCKAGIHLGRICMDCWHSEPLEEA